MLLVVALIDYGVLLVSQRLDNLLTHERTLVMEKAQGILLAALSVQLSLAGSADVGVVTLSGGHQVAGLPVFQGQAVLSLTGAFVVQCLL